MTSKSARHKKNQRARKPQSAAAVEISATPAETDSKKAEAIIQGVAAPDTGISVTPPVVSHAYPLEVKEIEGKGMGVVATRDIKARELILKETPLFIWDHAKGTSGLEASVNALPDLKKTAYYSHFAADPHKKLSKAAAIFQTNCLPLIGNVKGVFDIGCRFNHSCRPNCSNQWDEEQEVRWFIANRDIRKGEEICITYTDLKEAKMSRSLALHVSFGFICTCGVCSLPGQAAKASHRRRIEYKHVFLSIPQLRSRPLELIKRINEGLKFAKEEGIVLGTSDLAFEALTVCVMLGDRLNATRWIDQALELEGYVAGVWSKRYKDIEAWKGQPELHPSWMAVCRTLGLPSQVLTGPDQD
ncbi:hypothetical protein JCM5353_008960 [Sporobolomyces roseus]